MRALLVSVMLISSAVLAQPVPGTWSGYVNGFVPTTRTTTTYGNFDNYGPTWGPGRRPPTLSVQQQQLLVLSQLSAQQAYLSQLNFTERQKEFARQQEADALAAQQRLSAQQEVLIAQQQAAQAQLLAQQQQLVAQQQQLAAQAQQREADSVLARIADERAQAEKRDPQ